MEPNKEQPQHTSTEDDNIFVVKTEPKEPISKKSVWITVAATISGVIILIAVLIGALVASAGGLAEDYRGTALQQLKKIDPQLKNLEPGLVISNRDISVALDKIYISKQAQPSLASTLFFDELNAKYASTKKTQTKIKQHYSQLDMYTAQLKQLIEFDDQVGVNMQQEAELAPRVNPEDPSTIRSVGGSYQDIASKIKKLPAPTQIKSLQRSLVETYSARAASYLKWAVSVEAGDKSTAPVIQAELAVQKDKASALVTDKKYVELFTPSYKKLIANQKSIESALVN